MARKTFKYARLVMKYRPLQCNGCARFLQRYQSSGVNIACLIDQSLEIKGRSAQSSHALKLTYTTARSYLRAHLQLEDLGCHVSLGNYSALEMAQDCRVADFELRPFAGINFEIPNRGPELAHFRVRCDPSHNQSSRVSI